MADVERFLGRFVEVEWMLTTKFAAKMEYKY